MIKLATKELCTGCGACAYICPKQCISMREDTFGVIYPVINHEDCISCKRCQKVCPILTPVQLHTPSHAYAAWSNDENERKSSASGGVAPEMYKLSLNKQWLIAGAGQNTDFSVTLFLTEQKEDILKFKNSKYVFSTAYSLYPEIKNALREGKHITVIGLPCQIAAIRNVFKDNDNLFLVDLVCHGTTPYEYLIQHIHSLEQEYGQKARRMYFRDPNTYTYTFTFTLYNNEGIRFCERKIEDGDAYQVGYHKKITYRENCYHCQYAKFQRTGHLTIADYHGLGMCAPCSFTSRNVSLILENSQEGEMFLTELRKKKSLTLNERPLDEPVKGEIQLRHPSTKTSSRRKFEKNYNGDFSITMTKVLNHYYRIERWKTTKRETKRIIRKIIKALLSRK